VVSAVDVEIERRVASGKPAHTRFHMGTWLGPLEVEQPSGADEVGGVHRERKVGATTR